MNFVSPRRAYFFYSIKEKGRSAALDATGRSHFTAAFPVHFWCIFCGGSTTDSQARQASITNIVEPCRPSLSWVGFHCLWGVDAFRTECHWAITHPLKGNSVFSEREALLKCTERFGPNPFPKTYSMM